MKRITGLLFCVVLMGCAASGPTYTEIADTIPTLGAEQTRLFFMRPDRFYYSGRGAPITINNQRVGKCANGGFFYVDMAPQTLTISTRLSDVAGKYTLTFTPKAGQTYYIQILPRDESAEAAMLHGVLGTLAESGGKKQGGAFSLYILKEEAALKILSNLAFSG